MRRIEIAVAFGILGGAVAWGLPKVSLEIPDVLFPVLLPGWRVAGFFSLRAHGSAGWAATVVFFNALIYAAVAYGLMSLDAWRKSR